MEMNTATQVNRGYIGGAAMMGGNLGMAGEAEGTTPTSPVQTRLQRKQELLADLEQTVNSLIEPLMPVLSRDPREVAKQVSGAPIASNPSTCELEAILMGENERIAEAIDRLRDIRSAIRL